MMKIAGLFLVAVLSTVIIVMPIAGLTELHGNMIWAFRPNNDINITETAKNMVESGPIKPNTYYYVFEPSDSQKAILVFETNSGIKGLWVPVLSALQGHVVFEFKMGNSVNSTALAEYIINLKPDMNYYVFEPSNSTSASESSNSADALLVLASWK
jgi:hypothetical protein